MNDNTAIVQIPPRHERLVSVDTLPMLDTSKFEQMWRVAGAMAAMNILPAHLKGSQADCFMVVNLAVRLGFDPFSLAQVTSVISGRIMIEGKAVHAAVTSKLGIRLRCTYEGPEKDLTRKVTVIGRFPDENEDRTITGTVNQWRTQRGGSPWTNPEDWDRMLFYRGTREWCRLHSPEVILGIMTPDEYEPAKPIEPLNAALTDQSEDGAVATFKALKETKAKKGKTETVEDAETGIAMTITKNPDTAPINVPAPEIVHVDSLNDPRLSGATETASIPEATQEVQDAVDALVEGITVDADGIVTITQEPEADNAEKSQGTSAPQSFVQAADDETDPLPADGVIEETAEETPDPFAALWSGLMNAPNWISAKTILVENTTRSELFNGLAETDQQLIRRKVWQMASQAGWQDGPDEKSDPTAWRFWVDAQDGPEGAIQIEATTRVLKKEAKFEKLADNQKDNMMAIMNAAIARCGQ